MQPSPTTDPSPTRDATSLPARRAPSGGDTGFRPEIQGLRAVAVLLVAVYHIWFGRVSGGVDVFLLLTGFLITLSLVRTVERDGRVDVAAFWARLVRRLVPAAAVALAGILAATFLFLPQDRWRDSIDQVIAASLYHENWWLSVTSVDYLAQNTGASPVQHFWSLSIQGQSYLVWPFLVVAAGWVAARSRWGTRRGTLAAMAAVLAVSLTYSVVSTQVNQQWAYFDTGARLWELALGGILAMLLPYARLPRPVRVALGWIGLAALVCCGALLDVSTMFPGYVALWPTLAAAAVILAGTTGSRVGVDRLLTWKPLRAIGDLSYALYLWHWPVLVCYLAVTDRTVPSLLGGGCVLGLSLVLAAATTRLVDGGAGRLAQARPGRLWSVAVGLVFLVPVLTAGGGWSAYLIHQQREREAFVADPANYPGARTMEGDGSGTPPRELPLYPSAAEVDDDVPATYEDGCNQDTESPEVLTCEYGSDNAKRTIALVGGSHAAHWFSALEDIAADNDWRVVNIVKGACLFTDAPQRYKGEEYTSCAQWNDGVLDELGELRPDAVFTTATSSSVDPDAGFGGEVVVDGYLDRWRELDELGIEVIAVRDTPRLGFDSPECLAQRSPSRCVGTRSDSLRARSPLRDVADPPGNVSFLDLNGYLCDGDDCPTVIGNVQVYWDESHITATYMRTLAPMLERDIRRATGW